MPTTTEKTGKCLCGAVRVTAKQANTEIGACHCGMCRKWCGGPLFAVDCGAEVVFEGEENISVFGSSAWADRGFCKQCGSPLFFRIKESSHYMLPAGVFDDDQGLVFAQQIFIDEKPSFYTFADKTENMTGAEMFAQFASSSK